MIKIQKYAELEPDFFDGRKFGDSNEVVKSVLEEVQKKGDTALRIYGQKFDVSVPTSFEVPVSELKAAAEKLKIEIVNKLKKQIEFYDNTNREGHASKIY